MEEIMSKVNANADKMHKQKQKLNKKREHECSTNELWQKINAEKPTIVIEHKIDIDKSEVFLCMGVGTAAGIFVEIVMLSIFSVLGVI